jgi:hypothetical protein
MLPLGLIYRNDILDAIDTVFNSVYTQDRYAEDKNLRYKGYRRTSFKTDGDLLCFLQLSHYGLHKLSTDILQKNVSYRDFRPCVEKMTKDGDLREYESMDSKRNIKTKLYSQTRKARLRYRLRIKQETIGPTEKAYQLLLMYRAFKDAPPIGYDKNILENDEKLERFLATEFGLHTSDFIVNSVSHNRDLYHVTHMIRKIPVPAIRYSRIDYLKGSGRLEGKHYYRYRLPGISVKEFLRGAHGGQALEDLPRFLSHPQVENYFHLLEQEHLIKQVLVFHGESRYDLVDVDLRSFLKDCWVVHGIACLTMRDIWKLVRKPTEEEREWYEMLWGRQRTMIHVNRDYQSLKSREKDPNKKGYRKTSNEGRSRIMDWGYRGIVEHFESMKEKHSTTIKKHAVVSHMLMKMVYPQFLQNLTERKMI